MHSCAKLNLHSRNKKTKQKIKLKINVSPNFKNIRYNEL